MINLEARWVGWLGPSVAIITKCSFQRHYHWIYMSIFVCGYCQTPDLGKGLELTLLSQCKKNNNNKKNNPHLNFPGWDGTRGLKFGTQT